MPHFDKPAQRQDVTSAEAIKRHKAKLKAQATRRKKRGPQRTAPVPCTPCLSESDGRNVNTDTVAHNLCRKHYQRQYRAKQRQKGSEQ